MKLKIIVILKKKAKKKCFTPVPILYFLQDRRLVFRAEEVVHVVHGPHDARGSRRSQRHQRVSVPVQEQQMELLHRRGLDCVRTDSIYP
jgi:hypothetical protein